MRITRPRATKLDQIGIYSDLDMGAYSIILGVGQTVDGVDVSDAMTKTVYDPNDDGIVGFVDSAPATFMSITDKELYFRALAQTSIAVTEAWTNTASGLTVPDYTSAMVDLTHKATTIYITVEGEIYSTEATCKLGYQINAGAVIDVEGAASHPSYTKVSKTNIEINTGDKITFWLAATAAAGTSGWQNLKITHTHRKGYLTRGF